jgi:hypothetical protein
LLSQYDDECKHGCEAAVLIMCSTDAVALMKLALLLSGVALDETNKSWITRSKAVRCLSHVLKRLEKDQRPVSDVIVTTTKLMLTSVLRGALTQVVDKSRVASNMHHMLLFIKCLRFALKV